MIDGRRPPGHDVPGGEGDPPEQGVLPAEGVLPREGVLPDPGTIHVWTLDVTEPWLDALADAAIVSEVERDRAERMASRELARALLARRTVLRYVLGRYLGRPAEEMRVVAAPGGKPVLLPDPGLPALAFSVGHADDLYGVAVGTAARIGFDVEGRREVPRAEAIARRWFGEAESRVLDGLERDARQRAFIRLWTGKEALAKRHGAGLRLMMRGDVAELDTVAAEREGRLRWIAPREEYLVAVASSDVVERIAVVAPEGDGWMR